MQLRRLHLLLLALGVLSLGLLVILPVAHAQGDSRVVGDPYVGLVNAMIDLASSFSSSGRIGKVLAALTTISGFCAFTVKPFWDRYVYPRLVAYVQSTVTKKDDELLDRVLSNKFVKVLLYLLNLVAHIKVPIVNAAGEAVSPTRAGLPTPPQQS